MFSIQFVFKKKKTLKVKTKTSTGKILHKTTRQQLVANQRFHTLLYYTQVSESHFLGTQTQFMFLRHCNYFIQR